MTPRYLAGPLEGDEARLTHEAITDGGTLTLNMGSTASSWGG